MTKVAKLVTVSLTTRVVVDENATEEQIAEATKQRYIQRINNNEVLENITEIVEDKECPFGTFTEDSEEGFYFQPDLDHPTMKKLLESGEFNSFDVFDSKALAEKLFPEVEIKTYSGDDIEEPRFVDEDYE